MAPSALLVLSLAATAFALEPTCDTPTQECPAPDDVALNLMQTNVHVHHGKRDHRSASSKDIDEKVTAFQNGGMSKFENTMTAEIAVEGKEELSEAGILIALFNEEIRGVAEPSSPPFGPHQGKAFYQLTMGGKNGEELTFKYKDGNEVLDLAEALVFTANANLGNALNPEDMTPEAPPVLMVLNGEWYETTQDELKSGWPSSMTMVDFVEGGFTGKVGAFVDNELRGVAGMGTPIPFGPNKGKRPYFLMIYGSGADNGKKVTFKFHMAFSGQDYDFPFREEETYANDGHIGNVIEPYTLHFAR